MTESKWKPGDVAIRSYLGWAQRSLRVKNGITCRDNHPSGDHWHHADGGWDRDHALSTYRPLVVIDPEDREQVERLTLLFGKLRWGSTSLDRLPGSGDHMQAALRSLIEEPKPEEPTGLGAVVKDADGERWTWAGERDVLGRQHWRMESTNVGRPYRQVAAGKVLSEGVTP